MIYKYSISISGDKFDPDNIKESFKGNLNVSSFFKSTDRKPLNALEQYGYGNISFWHTKRFATDEFIIEYETDFVEFIEDNYSLFIENGAEDFEIYLELYFDGEQCNFEVFNKFLMKRVCDYEVSLSISVYVLGFEQIQKWEEEIKLIWSGNGVSN